ncbi:MAG: tetratricopeptide repeat protein [Lysobacter sp.]
MALNDPLDEHEQSERVLAWLRQNGMGLVLGIVLGLAAIGGWKWWQQHQHSQLLADADRYQAVVSAIGKGEPDVDARLGQLQNDLYADLAGLELAAKQVRAGENDSAIKTLRAIEAGDPAMADIVQQRLARLLVEAGKADEALTLLEGSSSAMALEVRGDAQYALGNADQARATYDEALTKMDVASPRRKLLELKLIEVGGTPADTEAQS